MLKLQELGFTNAYALLGGLNAWQAATLPTEMVTEETWTQADQMTKEKEMDMKKEEVKKPN